MNNSNLQICPRSGKRDACLRSLFLTYSLLAFSLPVAANKLPMNTDASQPIPEFDCVIEPSKIVDVGSAVTGIIHNIHVYRSELVKKGAVLAALQPSVELATVELTKMRANQNIAIKLRREIGRLSHQTQQRNQLLVQRSVISMQDMDTLKTETRIAELQVEQEQANKHIARLEYLRAMAVLQQRTIRSPIDGVVMELFKSEGEYVENKPLLRVAQLDPLHIELIIPVEYLGRISRGMQARVTSMLPAAQSYLATVERVDMVSDAASGTYGVRLALPNPDYKIPAGLRCRAAFVSQEQPPQPNEVAAEIDASSSTLSSSEPARALIIPVSNNLSFDIQARQLRDPLLAQPESVATAQMVLNQNNRYLVLATPKLDLQKTRRLQDDLRALSISEHYIIRDGIHIARLALGFFKNQKNADNRQQALEEKGFNTEIVSIDQY